MAESKDADEMSSSGSVILKKLTRTFSLKKRRESIPDGTDSKAKPASPDTEKSPSTEAVFMWTQVRRSLRRSLNLNKKERDAATSTVEEESTSNGDYNNIPPTPLPESPSTEAGGMWTQVRRSLNRSLNLNKKECDAATSTVVEEESTSNGDYNNIPPTPLPVMEINSLIGIAALKDAYLNILSLQNEVQCEQKALDEKSSPGKLTNKKEDLKLLFNNLRDKLADIVRQSCVQPSCNKELLVQVAGIIQNNEKREIDLMEREEKGWRDVWKTAIQQGVKETLMNSSEQNNSVIEVHLERLGKKIVELLEIVKRDILNLYPPSFPVFETYASSCNKLVNEHLKVLLGKTTELKDYNSMLDFAINCYQREMMLSGSLQPEMKQQTFLTLSDDLLSQMKNAYCDCLQDSLHASLDDIIHDEQENVWKNKVTPKRTEDGIVLTSDLYTHVCEMIKKYSDSSAKIDENLEKMCLCKCIEALQHFPKRFEETFSKQSRSLLGSDLLDCCLWAEYHVAYINSFSFLREHIAGYREKFPVEVDILVTEVDGLIDRLRQALLKQFRDEFESCLGGLMTKEWLNKDTNFSELVNKIESYSGYSKSMKQPHAQSFANDVHYHVVKGYISELLKNKFSCKGRKNDDAAAKIYVQWTELKKLFCEMGSTLAWLHPLGYQISKIIEQENEKNIKEVLTPLVENYPDISKKQFSAILNFRDNGLKFDSPAIRCFSELKRKIDTRKTENSGNCTFFSDITEL